MPAPTVAAARCDGFLAGCNRVSLLHAYRRFRRTYGRVDRRVGAALVAAWWEGRECRSNALSRAA